MNKERKQPAVLEEKRKVLHLISTGNSGGIQTLMKDYSLYSQLNNLFVFMWAGGPNEEEMRRNNATVICLEANKVGTLQAAKRLIHYFNAEKPDAVIVHISPLLRMIAAYMKQKNRNMKLFFYCHSDMKDQLGQYGFAKRQIYDAINRACIKKCDRIIAISNYVRKTILATYPVSDRKISVIYNAVDIKKFDVPIHCPDQTIKLVFVGRLIKEKGVQIALQALKELPVNILWQFNIVGDGKYKNELVRLVHSLGLEDKVVFWGNRKDIPQILAKMDIFLHACIWEEGFGIGIIEAMAAGKVCVCSDSGAIPEIITDGKDGYLVAKENIEALSQILIKIMEDRKGWESIQVNAKSAALKYGAEKFARELDRLMLCQSRE